MVVQSHSRLDSRKPSVELSRSGVDSVCYGNPSIRVRVDESCRYRCPSWPTGTKAASSSGHRFLIEICESRKATGIGIIGEMGSSVVGDGPVVGIFGLLEGGEKES